MLRRTARATRSSQELPLALGQLEGRVGHVTSPSARPWNPRRCARRRAAWPSARSAAADSRSASRTSNRSPSCASASSPLELRAGAVALAPRVGDSTSTSISSRMPADGVEVDLELVDPVAPPDDLLDRARVDVGPADELHVVDAPADAAVVDVEGPPAGAGRRGHAADEVARPVAQDGNEAAAEGGHHALAQLAVGHRLVGRGVDDLLEVVVLDDVRAAGLVRRTRRS